MGYQRPTLKLVFTDPEMDGLEVRARRLSVNEVFALSRLSSKTASRGDDDEVGERDLEELASILACAVLSWNLELPDGSPAPITSEGMRGQDMVLLKAISVALMQSSAGVARPLPDGSNSGEPALEASIPMTALPSENPQS